MFDFEKELRNLLMKHYKEQLSKSIRAGIAKAKKSKKK